jgi:hypothetical protein
MRYAVLTTLLLTTLSYSQPIKAQTGESLEPLTNTQRQGIARAISHFDRIDLALKFGKMVECRRLWDKNRNWVADTFTALPPGTLRTTAIKMGVAYKATIDMLTLLSTDDPDLDKIEPIIKEYELQDLPPSEMPGAIYRVALTRKKAVALILADSPTK